MKVPYNDLSRIHGPLEKKFIEIFKNTLNKNQYIGGEPVSNFEAKLQKVFKVKNVVACANGTDAILGCLKALELKPGDEVIVPSMTWISSAEVVNLAGGTPIFCDVDEESFVAEAANIQQAITAKTKGIILVHLYGNMPDMDKIMHLLEKNNLWMIEDCAQAHLSTYKGRAAGTFGDFGTFSFFPGKNLGAFGDAGAICAKEKEKSEYIRAFFNHGAVRKHNHTIIGTNSRLDSLQAEILNLKMDYIEEWTKSRISISKIYDQELNARSHIGIQKTHKSVRNSKHIYPILVDDRDKYLSAFNSANISTNLNYPSPLHMQPVYRHSRSNSVSLSVSENIGTSQISLPIFPNMKDQEIEYVIENINKIK